MTLVKAVAAALIVAALVALFAVDDIRVSAALLIIGNLVNLADQVKART
jgi:hypothetical protein